MLYVYLKGLVNVSVLPVSFSCLSKSQTRWWSGSYGGQRFVCSRGTQSLKVIDLDIFSCKDFYCGQCYSQHISIFGCLLFFLAVH